MDHLQILTKLFGFNILVIYPDNDHDSEQNMLVNK